MNKTIETFIRDNFYVPDDVELTPDASLLDTGIVDSTGVLEIVSFLEQQMNITVDDMEIVPDNLDSIASIEAFVSRKRAAGRQSA